MKVAVVGSGGPVGVATVRALLDRNVHVLAVTRHPPAAGAGSPPPPPPPQGGSPAASLAAPSLPAGHPHLTITAGTAADAAGLTATLVAAAPLDGVAVITPGTAAPAGLVAAAVGAAAAAGARRVTVVSMLLAGKGDFTYARWMGDAEAAARAAAVAAAAGGGGGGGPRLALVRLANFYENWLGAAAGVATAGVLRDAFRPATRVPSVAVADAGEAVAAAAVDAAAAAAAAAGGDGAASADGAGADGGCRVYDIVGGVETLPQVASAVAAAVGRPVSYEPLPADAARQRLVAAGVPDWAAAAAMEMYAWLDDRGGWAVAAGGGSG